MPLPVCPPGYYLEPLTVLCSNCWPVCDPNRGTPDECSRLCPDFKLTTPPTTTTTLGSPPQCPEHVECDVKTFVFSHLTTSIISIIILLILCAIVVALLLKSQQCSKCRRLGIDEDSDDPDSQNQLLRHRNQNSLNHLVEESIPTQCMPHDSLHHPVQVSDNDDGHRLNIVLPSSRADCTFSHNNCTTITCTVIDEQHIDNNALTKMPPPEKVTDENEQTDETEDNPDDVGEDSSLLHNSPVPERTHVSDMTNYHTVDPQSGTEEEVGNTPENNHSATDEVSERTFVKTPSNSNTSEANLTEETSQHLTEEECERLCEVSSKESMSLSSRHSTSEVSNNASNPHESNAISTPAQNRLDSANISSAPNLHIAGNNPLQSHGTLSDLALLSATIDQDSCFQMDGRNNVSSNLVVPDLGSASSLEFPVSYLSDRLVLSLESNDPHMNIQILSGDLGTSLCLRSDHNDYSVPVVDTNCPATADLPQTPRSTSNHWGTILTAYDAIEENLRLLPWIAGCQVSSSSVHVIIKQDYMSETNEQLRRKLFNFIPNGVSQNIVKLLRDDDSLTTCCGKILVGSIVHNKDTQQSATITLTGKSSDKCYAFTVGHVAAEGSHFTLQHPHDENSEPIEMEARCIAKHYKKSAHNITWKKIEDISLFRCHTRMIPINDRENVLQGGKTVSMKVTVKPDPVTIRDVPCDSTIVHVFSAERTWRGKISKLHLRNERGMKLNAFEIKCIEPGLAALDVSGCSGSLVTLCLSRHHNNTCVVWACGVVVGSPNMSSIVAVPLWEQITRLRSTNPSISAIIDRMDFQNSDL